MAKPKEGSISDNWKHFTGKGIQNSNTNTSLVDWNLRTKALLLEERSSKSELSVGDHQVYPSTGHH